MNDAPDGRRSGCLTAWLLLMILGGLIGALSYLTGGAMVQRGFQQAHVRAPSSGVMFWMALLSLANVACAVAVWRWKRWGFYAVLAIAVLGIVTNAAIGFSVGTLLFSLIGPAILYFLLRPFWDRME